MTEKKGQGDRDECMTKELYNMEIHTAPNGRNIVIMSGIVSFLGNAFFLASFSRTFACGRGLKHAGLASSPCKTLLPILFRLQHAAKRHHIFFLFETFFIVGPKNENSLLSLDSNTDCTSPERGNSAILILLLQERTMVHAVFSFNENTLFFT